MSNYVQTTFFTPKDTLPTTNPAKTIFGAAYDVEFGNIAAAISSKYDNTTAAPSLLSLTVGTPTGGNLGAGSINAQSISVNNVAVALAGAVVTSITGTANQIASSASTGAVTLSFPSNVIIPTPVSGDALSATAIGNGNAARFNGSATSGQSFGLVVAAGTTSADNAIRVLNQALTATFFSIFGDGHGLLGPSATLGLTWTLNGNVSIATPASGNTLTLSQVIGSRALVIQSPASTSALMELVADNGTLGTTSFAIFQNTSSLDAFFVQRAAHQIVFQTNATTALTIAGDGSLTVGTPTGGNQGIGTLNATGLFINAGQLFFGVPASASTTAAVTDVGKCINAAAGITVPNAVFSQGHAFSIYNNTAGAITITAGITTMRLAGTAITGNRTLAQRGIATVWFESGTECAVGGPGVS